MAKSHSRMSGGAGGGPARCLTVPGDWKAAAKQLGMDAPEAVPPGWKSRADLQRELGMTSDRVRHMLLALSMRGGVEVRRFRVPTFGRGQYPVPHYRLTKRA